MDNKPFFTGRYIEIPKTTIWQKTEDGKNARLAFGFRDGMPRFQVSGFGGKGVDGMIVFGSNYVNMDLVCDELMSLGDKPPGYKYHQTYQLNQYEDNKPTDKKRLVSTLYVGKSEQGVCYIMIRAEKKPDIVFTFLNDDWNISYVNKEQMTKEEYSKRYARNYGLRCKKLMNMAMYAHADEHYRFTNPDLGFFKQKDGSTTGTPQTTVVSSLADFGF